MLGHAHPCQGGDPLGVRGQIPAPEPGVAGHKAGTQRAVNKSGHMQPLITCWRGQRQMAWGKMLIPCFTKALRSRALSAWMTGHSGGETRSLGTKQTRRPASHVRELSSRTQAEPC